jgi:hypothetical protein
MRILVYTLGILLLSSTAFCSDEASVDIEDFIQCLTKAEVPTLSDYHRFFGSGAESEIQILHEICKRKRYLPPERHEECLNLIKHREAHRDQTPSLYLLWLKTKLPLGSKLIIHDVRQVRREDSFPYELITATLGHANIVFFRPLKWKIQFGVVSISKINGIPVKEIFEEDLRNPDIIQELLREADRRTSANNI